MYILLRKRAEFKILCSRSKYPSTPIPIPCNFKNIFKQSAWEKKKAETGMKLENVVLTEMPDKERQILYDITYMYNLTYSTNECIYKRETDTQI